MKAHVSSIRSKTGLTIGVLALLLSAKASAAAEPHALSKNVTRVPVVFSGGHETEGADRGRPVVLIAAALRVKPEVFREAFSHVHPAGPGSGGPTDAEVRENKASLMRALGKYGITNERLDTVSNYYRYPPGRGEVWRNQPAVANALVKNGAITGFEIISGGAGYSSPPTVSVPGVASAPAEVELSFGKVLEANGSVTAITILPGHSR
jgi:hypothetical protein